MAVIDEIPWRKSSEVEGHISVDNFQIDSEFRGERQNFKMGKLRI